LSKRINHQLLPINLADVYKQTEFEIPNLHKALNVGCNFFNPTQMKRLLILISTVQVFFGCSINNKSDNYAFQAAISDFQKGDFISCQKKLEDYTKKYPNDYQGWSFLGTVALELENDSLAGVVLSNAILLNPNDYKGLTGLGILERKKRNYDKAVDLYSKAVFINPKYGKAHSSLVVIELIRGNFDKAVQLGETAIKLDTVDLGIKGNLSVAYHYTKQNNKRDELVNELAKKGYPYVKYLQLVFDGTIKLDDL
jgi:tetratricopeptide (TPR) repeat protein